MQTMADEKLEDYLRNPNYERKIVVFYDTLGWRGKIAAAGDKPEKIGDLRRQILGDQRLYKTRAQDQGAMDVRATSFSDNVVMSLSVTRGNLLNILGGLACTVLESTERGFLVRGGVTIGNIVHDDEAVFGPGLNRAHELESELADYPRIILDEVVVEALQKEFGKQYGRLPLYIATEHGWSFIDPFTREFLGLVATLETEIPKEFFERSGLPPTVMPRPHRDIPHDLILRSSLDGLKPYLKQPLPDKEWRRLSWLYDRIARRIGVPLASSYPRVSA
jgi:hypothetical protein